MQATVLGFLLAATACPLLAQAQVKGSVAVPSVTTSAPRFISASDISAVGGSTLSLVTTYGGFACGSAGCTVAKGTGDGKAAMSLHLGGAKDRVSEVRVGILLPHGQSHTLQVSLNGIDLAEFLCDATFRTTPSFSSLGASGKGFNWEIYEGAKLLRSGHSAGKGVSLSAKGDMKSVPMELAISESGVIEVVHGGSRIVLTSDQKAAVLVKSGGYLKFENLGLRVAGPGEFAVTSTKLSMNR